MPGGRGPWRYDRSLPTLSVRPTPFGATPAADHLVELLRGQEKIEWAIFAA